MIHSEKVLLKTLTKLVTSPEDIVFCDSENGCFSVVQEVDKPPRDIAFPFPDVDSVVRRLSSYGYVQIQEHPFHLYFSMTYVGLHHFEYSFDDLRRIFFSKFVCGFITGALSGAAGVLLSQYLMRILHL